MKNIINPIGVGLRHIHFPYLEDHPEIKVDFFEIISENYINTRGRPFEMAMKLRESFPIYMHGVSLSIAGTTELNFKYLEKLKILIEIIKPEIVSDHLCFTGFNSQNLHNLLPFAYTKENLNRISKRVNIVQEYLGREILLENLSAYFSLKNSEMNEGEFLDELANKTGAKILFDINNLYVNSINQKFNPDEFTRHLNFKNIGQIHLAGHSDFGEYLFDTHDHPVTNSVWELYKKLIPHMPGVPVLIEWDDQIPDYKTVEMEALKAREYARI
jgi:uncharacterized protein (UPF0276 family)